MTDPVIGLLEATWASTARVGASLSPAEWALPTDCPGWSVRDQVAHLIGTERAVEGAPLPMEPVAAPHVRNALGAFNEAWVEHYRAMPPAEVLADFRAVTARRLSALAATSDEELDAVRPSPLGDMPYRDFLAIRVFDSFAHEQDVRRATGRRGGADGPVARLAVGRCLAGMPKAVAKQAGAPDGTVVEFDVTGPAGRTATVVVDRGRGRLEVGGASFDVRLTLEAETLWCLALGRWDAGRAGDLVGLEGDRELGTRVIAGMNILF